MSVAIVRCKNRRCKKTSKAGTLSLRGKAGANSFKFSGKLGGKRLKPGGYRARITAADAVGNKSGPIVVKFTVRR